MRMFKNAIQLHQTEISNHALFELIESSRSAETIARVARAISWWPMVFQDVLRLNLDRVEGSDIAHAARCHRDEDAGHDQWFLEDLRIFDVEAPGLEELFGPQFQPIRDACYSLLAEVHGAQSAAQRIALLLTLESTGHIFFEKVADAVDRVCPQLPLRYFGRFHLTVEKDHDLFADSTKQALDEIVLPETDRVECQEMLTRVYGVFGDMFSYLAESARESRHTSHVRQLAATDVHARPVRLVSGS